MKNTEKTKIFDMPFSKIYECYISKAKKKGIEKFEVDEIISWLTGYKNQEVENKVKSNIDLKNFLLESPKLNPLRTLIKGTICGINISEIKDPTMKEIRYLDKLIDELSKWKPLEIILMKNWKTIE